MERVIEKFYCNQCDVGWNEECVVDQKWTIKYCPLCLQILTNMVYDMPDLEDLLATGFIKFLAKS